MEHRVTLKLDFDGLPGKTPHTQTPVIVTEYADGSVSCENDAISLWPLVAVVGKPGESARLVVARWLVAMIEKLESEDCRGCRKAFPPDELSGAGFCIDCVAEAARAEAEKEAE